MQIDIHMNDSDGQATAALLDDFGFPPLAHLPAGHFTSPGYLLIECPINHCNAECKPKCKKDHYNDSSGPHLLEGKFKFTIDAHKELNHLRIADHYRSSREPVIETAVKSSDATSSPVISDEEPSSANPGLYLPSGPDAPTSPVATASPANTFDEEHSVVNHDFDLPHSTASALRYGVQWNHFDFIFLS
ncbi:hypothetical protein D9757_005303 [Collybiopsis confluens]|uniref:Uncharacterized protein n=1 Tax=Collybiopsis confluens TaxID=2823264 RepID=A0A8H5ME76_9AGAR|nr:hypothetical protein D9757_005303 [Collybiopsis confluens]